MINRILGKIIEIQYNLLIIETQSGIFYEIEIPLSNVDLINLNKKYIIYTTFVINETQQRLFGFINSEDNLIFKKIIKINGIGPKTALYILDKANNSMLKKCLLSNDFSILLTVNGIGEKTYKRIVNDIKSVISKTEKIGLIKNKSNIIVDNSLRYEAKIALIALGYKENYDEFINKALNKSDDIANIIKIILKYISGIKK